jgi:hypothetical protein
MNKDDLRHLDTNVDLAMYALAHAIGIELKPSYYRQALANLRDLVK